MSLIGRWFDNDQLSEDEGILLLTTLPARLVSADKKTLNFYFVSIYNMVSI